MQFLIQGTGLGRLAGLLAMMLASSLMAEDKTAVDAVAKKDEGKVLVLFDGKSLDDWKSHDIGGI